MLERGGDEPLYWPTSRLRAAFATGAMSCQEITNRSIARLRRFDPDLHAFICALEEVAKRQARAADEDYKAGVAGPLAGIPISIKDTFDVAGVVSTCGSLAYRANVAAEDSGVVRRLRSAGAVFIGKTNTAEFGQSATTDNKLGEECRNPWDLSRTSGGSSGGAAASVGAGIVTVGLGADGGGSLRIPAAFCGLVGFKPTFGAVRDENGFPAMSDFCCAGPISRCIADARIVLSVLMEKALPRQKTARRLRIAWCRRPDDRPVDPSLAATVDQAVKRLSVLGHDIEEVDLPTAGWNDVFGPLVLEEEGRLRGQLLESHLENLTDYERVTLEAARTLRPNIVEAARLQHKAFVSRMDDFFNTFDLIIAPATATTAFPVGRRPEQIDGDRVGPLWGAFPFTAAFNVAGTPAVSLPCGLSEGMPVGMQLVCGRGRDAQLLDIAEDIEEVLSFDMSALMARYALGQPVETFA